MELGSFEAIVRFLNEGEPGFQLDTLKALDPNLVLQLKARELVLESRRLPDPGAACRQLEKALELDPCCAEACLEMAAISTSPESAMKWYARCMAAAEALLGEERMAELLEDFKQKPWLQLETHVWFKAKVSLAEKLFRNSYYGVAAGHFRDILALNPSDDLELRYYLLAALLGENNLAEAANFIRKSPNDVSAKWYYCRAFLRFKEEGDTRRSRRALARAFNRNLWVPVYLLDMEEMPPDDAAQFAASTQFKLGSRKEAADCVRCIGQVFCEDAKLTYWVWEVLKDMAGPEPK